MISDRALFRLAGLSAAAVIGFFVYQEWRGRRILAARGNKGYPIVTTTGIRG